MSFVWMFSYIQLDVNAFHIVLCAGNELDYPHNGRAMPSLGVLMSVRTSFWISNGVVGDLGRYEADVSISALPRVVLLIKNKRWKGFQRS